MLSFTAQGRSIYKSMIGTFLAMASFFLKDTNINHTTLPKKVLFLVAWRGKGGKVEAVIEIQIYLLTPHSSITMFVFCLQTEMLLEMPRRTGMSTEFWNW